MDMYADIPLITKYDWKKYKSWVVIDGHTYYIDQILDSGMLPGFVVCSDSNRMLQEGTAKTNYIYEYRFLRNNRFTQFCGSIAVETIGPLRFKIIKVSYE